MQTDRRDTALLLRRELTAPRTRALMLSIAAWSTPVVVFVALRELSEPSLSKIMQAVVILAFALVMSKWPGLAITSLCVGFPLAEVILPFLLRQGVPVGLVKNLRYWKEALVLALIVAAYRASKKVAFKLDGIDKIALGFLLLVGVYWLFPHTFPPDVVVAPDDARNLAFRTIALPITAFLAVRHAHIDPKWRSRALIAAVAAGVFLGLCAIFEILFSSMWQTFLNEQLQVTNYRRLVQNDTLTRTLSQSDPTLSGNLINRAGTVFIDPLRSGYAFIAPLAIALDMVRRRLRPTTMFAVGIIGVGLALTQTRSAILGGVVVLLGALRAGPGRSERSRAQLIFLVGLAALAVLPIVASSALGDRIAGAVNGSDQESAPFHQSRTQEAFDLVLENPLGIGLGRGGLSSVRYQLTGNVIAENYFLGLAEDTSVFGAGLFIVLLVVIVLTVRRRFPVIRDSSAATADLLCGLALGGLLLHSFDYVAVAAPAFVVAGLAVAVGGHSRTSDEDEADQVLPATAR
jgi:hypothetical protein